MKTKGTPRALAAVLAALLAAGCAAGAGRPGDPPRAVGPADLAGSWRGTLRSARRAAPTVDMAMTFVAGPAGEMTGDARFRWFDGTEATGTVDQVAFRGDVITFLLQYGGGRPGLDATYATYRLRMLDADTLTGTTGSQIVELTRQR